MDASSRLSSSTCMMEAHEGSGSNASDKCEHACHVLMIIDGHCSLLASFTTAQSAKAEQGQQVWLQ